MIAVLSCAIFLTSSCSGDENIEQVTNDELVDNVSTSEENEVEISSENDESELSEEELLKNKFKDFYNNYPSDRYLVAVEDVVLENYFILDVRSNNDWAQGHLAESINIPRPELGERMNEIPEYQPILVVCNTGQSAAQTAGILNFVGFDAQSLSGGYQGWLHSQDLIDGLFVFELEAYMNDNSSVQFIDIRERNEFNDYHIDGFTNIPLSELDERAYELDSSKEVVLVCRTINRSKQAALSLKESGFETVRHVVGISGGMVGWEELQ